MKTEPEIPWKLLRRVSRSFALTLEFLPREIRHPISLAYLLARLSDTEADGAATDAERELLRRKAEIEALLEASSDRSAIEEVWTTIRRGQTFDAERFRPGVPPHAVHLRERRPARSRFSLQAGRPRALPLTPEELDHYTYLVAGCVGEFWTRICHEKMPGFASRPLEEMIRLGIDYGKGLQLVNILRDRQADAACGRVYVPPERFAETENIARSFLESAARYCSALRPWRLRAATVLPCLLAEKTLDLVRDDPDHPRVKIRRATLWVCVFRAVTTLPRAQSAAEGCPSRRQEESVEDARR